MENKDWGGHGRDPVSEKVVLLTMKGLLCPHGGSWEMLLQATGSHQRLQSQEKSAEINNESTDGFFH